MRAIGNLGAYAQYEAAGAIKDAAQNPGMGGMGVGMGVGAAMGHQMAQSFQQQQPGMQQPGPAAGPPPIPQPVQFFVAVGGQQSGPFDLAALQQQVQSGQLTRESLVWKQGMAQWMPAGEVQELANLFGQAPPPIPPGPPPQS